MQQEITQNAPQAGTDITNILDTVARMGRLLLQNGAEIHRVEDTMKRVAAHFGVVEEEFFVLSNGIFITGGDKSHKRLYANVRHIPVQGTRMDRIVAINQLSREIIADGLTLAEISQRLDAIETMPQQKTLMRLLGACLSSMAFCLIYGGTPFDCVAAGIAGLLLYVFVIFISEKYLSKITGNLFGGALATLICVLLCELGIGTDMHYMVIGAIVTLIPGVAMTYGVRDIASGDYLSGIVRMLDAILVFCCIAIGVGSVVKLGIRLVGLGYQAVSPASLPAMLYVPMEAMAAFAGTVGFAILFCVPGIYRVACGLIGMAGWLFYLLLTHVGLPAPYATFFASFLVVLTSRYVAVLKKSPATVFMVAGLFPLIPGAGFYWTAYYLVSGETATAGTTGFGAIKAVIGLVLGIVCVLELPGAMFQFGHKKQK